MPAGAAASTLLGGVLNVGPFGLIPSLPAVGSGTNLAEGFAKACGEDLGGEGVPEEGQRPNPNPGTLPGPLLRLLVSAKVPGAAFGSPFAFKRYGQSGLPVSELFPHVAKHADDLCVIRSMQADVPNHEPSLMLMNCGENQ